MSDGGKTDLLPDGPPRAQDNPAASYEASTAFDVRCRHCGRIAVRVSKGDSLDGLEKAAGQHDCPVKLAPNDWLEVAQAAYQAYRENIGSMPWDQLATRTQGTWLSVATAAVREYVKRRK